MNYVGIDYHKAYSVLVTLNERGQLLNQARIAGNVPVAFAQYFQTMDGPAKVVLEGCRNWGYLYDLLHELPPIQEVLDFIHRGGDHGVANILISGLITSTFFKIGIK